MEQRSLTDATDAPLACVCEAPGFCPRHARDVTRTGIKVCLSRNARSIAAYFAPAPEPRLPPLAARAGNIMRAGREALAHLVRTGRALRSTEDREACLRVCREGEGLPASQVFAGHCDHYRPRDGTCGGEGGCGCKVAIKAKGEAWTCPLGRWPEPGGPPATPAPIAGGAADEGGTAVHPTIAKMVAPGQKRPGIWRGGIIQIHVTRACDLACFGCTQGSQLGGKPVVMTPEQFEAAVASLEGYWGVTGVFGGNPALSPHFEEYCRILKAHVPYERRGLWCNNLRGKGAVARTTFNPAHSNINVHLDAAAYQEFARDWPEALESRREHTTNGLVRDAVHSTPWVAMRDVVPDEQERWRLIGGCDINRHWSAMIGVFRGELRGWFCEVAGAQSMLHQDNPDWCGTGEPMPDTGVPVVPGWWRRPMADFAAQVETHCHACGIPLRRPGQLAVGGEAEEFSETHRFIARPKAKGRPVAFVGLDALTMTERPATEYLPNVTPGYRP